MKRMICAFACVFGLTTVAHAENLIDVTAELAAVRGNPNVVVELNRATIARALAAKWQEQLGLQTESAVALFTGMSSAQLYAAGLARSFPQLQTALSGSSVTKERTKVLGDTTRDLTYTPVPTCRLMDTRGFGAPIQGGAFAPGSRRTIVPFGTCGIPTSNVAALLISLTTHNLTVGSGGYITIVPPGAGISGTTDVFGAEWSRPDTRA